MYQCFMPFRSILRGILRSIFSTVMTHNLTLLDSTKYTDIIIYINAWLKWEQPGLQGRGAHLILIFEVCWLTLSTTCQVQNYRHHVDTEFCNHGSDRMLPWLTHFPAWFLLDHHDLAVQCLCYFGAYWRGCDFSSRERERKKKRK